MTEAITISGCSDHWVKDFFNSIYTSPEAIAHRVLIIKVGTLLFWIEIYVTP